MSAMLFATVAIICATISGTYSTDMFSANVHGVSQCNGDKVSELKNFIVGRIENNNFEINGTLILKDDIPGPINITCSVERCMSEDKPDTCEYQTTYKLKNFCDDIDKPKKTWTAFLDNIKIKKECPLRKGEYKINKYKLDLSVLQPLALSRAFRVFWKLTIRLDSPKYKEFFCMRNIFSLEPKNKLKRTRKT